MDENVIYALIPILIFSIPIVAIASNMISKWLKLKEKQLEVTANATAEQAAQYAGRIAVLEERVAVLERIATDKPSMLAAEIDGLKTKQLN
ncbi:hypothetical protein [Sandarakinorhabdus limnophila]|jgi:hypothetical protein|uniref:hypothetical protein n=1 Tax=Sandarakinorhabdus limnophila TaxID=210512 RepID=UPI0037CC20BE